MRPKKKLTFALPIAGSYNSHKDPCHTVYRQITSKCQCEDQIPCPKLHYVIERAQVQLLPFSHEDFFFFVKREMPPQGAENRRSGGCMPLSPISLLG